ncbi:MAG: hypothetical protein ABI972_04510 [Acidobacteriota bacterium]
MAAAIRLSVALCLASIGMAAEGAKPRVETPPVTVFFQFESPANPRTFQFMRAEIDRLFASVPLRFDWLRIEEAPEAGVVGEAIVVRFRGNCSLTGVPPLADERGPFAWAAVTDGVVQPFADVNCDRVRVAVHDGMWGGERGQADRYLGIGLARVVAHEIYHMYYRSRRHESAGVLRHSLTPMDLVSEKAELHPEDRSSTRKAARRE